MLSCIIGTEFSVSTFFVIRSDSVLQNFIDMTENYIGIVLLY